MRGGVFFGLLATTIAVSAHDAVQEPPLAPDDIKIPDLMEYLYDKTEVAESEAAIVSEAKNKAYDISKRYPPTGRDEFEVVLYWVRTIIAVKKEYDWAKQAQNSVEHAVKQFLDATGDELTEDMSEDKKLLFQATKTAQENSQEDFLHIRSIVEDIYGKYELSITAFKKKFPNHSWPDAPNYDEELALALLQRVTSQMDKIGKAADYVNSRKQNIKDVYHAATRLHENKGIDLKRYSVEVKNAEALAAEAKPAADWISKGKTELEKSFTEAEKALSDVNWGYKLANDIPDRADKAEKQVLSDYAAIKIYATATASESDYWHMLDYLTQAKNELEAAKNQRLPEDRISKAKKVIELAKLVKSTADALNSGFNELGTDYKSLDDDVKTEVSSAVENVRLSRNDVGWVKESARTYRRSAREIIEKEEERKRQEEEDRKKEERIKQEEEERKKEEERKEGTGTELPHDIICKPRKRFREARKV